ncbi:hypothetical protein MUG10_05525 [Xanthomonas prunicola]|uniref:DUF2974 domain-containing protein n=1 Tax=Xanthomonas prunicola TaxID=2053930 RepID=A0A9Q9J5S7_9XANT|nr:hypothetical protein [Xanthomonas prunicola]USJ01646.1 hypothetical protein MUG10_05525 [Xanthomonas prunicola]UXA50130.1 hypothetical protein M0D44_06270 [Xanthomonas prunicola]UXA58435.1 hypothetical protein M0D47_06305 [Xanthomonas prunicola]UXA60580.1 hypothetical protein M0D48_16590 [Xanthomonas prunicola]UXA66646.1 hypothetical protein M0D43_06520 [Xanthomonas prunicola]
MKPIDQALADASNDSYANRSRSDVGDNNKYVSLDGHKYKVFGYASDPMTGFHATAYQSTVAPHNVIIAYRGTDPGLFSGETKSEKADHALTTFQDIAVDAKMVRDTVNTQKPAADAFTAQMIAKAAAQGIPKSQVFATGHSLGGAVAEIEAAKYGLRGATYNAFGAAELIDGQPQPGFHLTNYRMAGDVVSAASPHVGEVVSLASKEDIQSLRAGRYLDAPAGSAPPNALIAMQLSDHGGQQHFHSKSPDNILEPHRFQEASQRYAEHKAGIDHFGRDVSQARAELSESLRQMHGKDGQGELSPNLRRQLNEYLALNVDPAIRDNIERNAPVQGVGYGLQYGADLVRASGHAVKGVDEGVEAVARKAGVYIAPIFPAVSLVGDAAHLHGQSIDAAGRIVGDGLESAKGLVERGAHAAAEAVVQRVHDPRFQAGAANAVNHIVDTYDAARVASHTVAQKYQDGVHAVTEGIDRTERTVKQAYGATKHALSEGVERAEHVATKTYDASRHAVSQAADTAVRSGTQMYESATHSASQGIDAAKHAAGQAYDTLTHPGQWFQREAPAHAPTQPHAPAPAAVHPQATPHAPAAHSSTAPAPGHHGAPSGAHRAPHANGHGIAALSAADQAMFARIRQDAPAHVGDAHVAQAMLDAKRNGITDAGKIDRVAMVGDTMWVAGTTPGFRAATDISQQPAPMHDTLQQAQALNQQREQQVAMDALQRQQDGASARGASAMV